MIKDIKQAFVEIGAELETETLGLVFDIDVRPVGGRVVYQIKYPWSDTITTEAIDVKPKLRHLVLDVSGERFPINARFLCGHDERHWFVASLPFDRRTNTVRGAMEALKPDILRREQKRKGVKHRLYRRKTAAYVRQGEWFFLPRPMMHVGELAVPNGQLVRGEGKPHQVEWIYQPAGREETFVRGAVSHPDHETIRLEVWHRVVQNQEVESTAATRPFTRVSYLD